MHNMITGGQMNEKWEPELLERGPYILAYSTVTPTEVVTFLPEVKGDYIV